MSQPIFVVDAFASEPGTGNPAGVCVLSSAASEEWMQKVAMEMNHAETAFLVPRGGSEWDLRWFTPVREVDLCGHATLASAWVLFQAPSSGDSFDFHTRSGVLTASRKGEQIELDFPAEPASELPISDAIKAICDPVWFGQNRMDYIVELGSEAEVKALNPDMAKVRELGQRGLIVTARGESYDFVSRFFAPLFGVDEDSVTGSAHCCLAPYWAAKLGKNPLTGFQASKRGGLVGVEVVGDRVKLRGQAVITLKGMINL